MAVKTLRSDLPPRVAIDLLWGPIFYRMWVRHEPVTPGFVAQVFENALMGLKPGRSAAKSGRAATQRARPRTRRA